MRKGIMHCKASDHRSKKHPLVTCVKIHCIPENVTTIARTRKPPSSDVDGMVSSCDRYAVLIGVTAFDLHVRSTKMLRLIDALSKQELALTRTGAGSSKAASERRRCSWCLQNGGLLLQLSKLSTQKGMCIKLHRHQRSHKLHVVLLNCSG